MFKESTIFDRDKLNSAKNFIFETFNSSMIFWTFSYLLFYILLKIQGEDINNNFGISMFVMLAFFSFNLIKDKDNFIRSNEFFRVKEFYY